jgi:long-subunit fatty acid transport protein
MKLRMPDSYGFGLAVRFSDSFTVDLDVYRTEWGKFTLEDSKGNETSPVSGKAKSESRVDATHQVRLGAEYLFILEKTLIPARAGIFYDPEPAEGCPEDYYGFSVGSGFVWKNLAMDAAYQFRWGNNVEGESIGVPNTVADVHQHLIYVSAIYQF